MQETREFTKRMMRRSVEDALDISEGIEGRQVDAAVQREMVRLLYGSRVDIIRQRPDHQAPVDSGRESI